MARIRSIKPELPQSESIGRVSRDARLLFIQIFTLVDDEGRARAASRMLASLLYPYDDDVPELIEGWLVELEREGCIRRYEAEGSAYLEVLNWLKHQKIDKPTRSRLPPFRETSPNTRETSRGLAPDLVSRIMDQDQDLGSSRAHPSDARSADQQDVANNSSSQATTSLQAEALPFTDLDQNQTSEPRAQSTAVAVRRSSKATAVLSAELTAAFEEWYAAYPKKMAPGGARSKYAAIIKAGRATAEQLLAGARRYAIQEQHTEPKYIKAPEVWLNKECWMDEPQARSPPPDTSNPLLNGMNRFLSNRTNR